MKNLIILSVVVVMVALLSGCSKSECPTQGIFQSQLSYCVDLCMHGKSDSGNNQDVCNMVCNNGKYAGGSAELKRLIEFYKCDKCSDCTPEQLKGIEEGKKQAEADAKLAYEKSIEEQRVKDK